MSVSDTGHATDTGKLCQRVGGDVLDRSMLLVDPTPDNPPCDHTDPTAGQQASTSNALNARGTSGNGSAAGGHKNGNRTHSSTAHQSDRSGDFLGIAGAGSEGLENQDWRDEDEQFNRLEREGEEEENLAEGEKPPEGEAKLLAELFAGAEGLHSAIDHGALEDASAPARRDAERRAEQVAQHAADAVLASRAVVQRRAVHMCVVCFTATASMQSASCVQNLYPASIQCSFVTV